MIKIRGKKVEVKDTITPRENLLSNTISSQPIVSSFTNIFARVKLVSVNSGYKLTARRRISAGQVIFYEKVLAVEASSSKEMYCSLCHRSVDRLTPCSSCAGAVFCGTTCLTLSQNMDVHQNVCPVKVNLNKRQLLALQLISGFTFKEAKMVIEDMFKKVYDQSSTQANSKMLINWRLLATSALFTRMKNDVNFDQLLMLTPNDIEERELLMETYELLESIQQVFSPTNPVRSSHPTSQAPSQDVVVLLYKLLYMLHYSPLAQEDANMISGKNGVKKVGLSWTALGGFGGLLGFSCQSNVQRRFNPRLGSIEYVATQIIQQNEDLLLNWWGSKGFKSKANKSLNQTSANAQEQPVTLVEKYYKQICSEKLCKCSLLSSK